MHFLVSDKELMQTESDTQPIRLYLSCNDPYFINYTDLPPEYTPLDSVLYFNNLSHDSNAPDGSSYLHADEFVGSGEVVPLSFGKFSLPSAYERSNLTFLDSRDQLISTENIRRSNNIPGEFVITGLQEGLARIIAEEQELNPVYYVPNRIWKIPMAVVELYPGKLHDALKTTRNLRYALNFNNRQTIWKYFLVDPVYQKFNKLSIINGKKEAIFDALDREQTQADDPLVFISKNPIPLLEYSEDTFRLVDDNKSPPVIKSLPRASPEQLYRDDTSSDQPNYSHIYI